MTDREIDRDVWLWQMYPVHRTEVVNGETFYLVEKGWGFNGERRYYEWWAL